MSLIEQPVRKVLINKKQQVINIKDEMNKAQINNYLIQVNHLNPEQLVQYFEKYESKIGIVNMTELRKSPKLKCKVYRQSIYYGEFQNGKKTGKGIMIYHDKRYYQGDWLFDQKNGFGYQSFINNYYLGYYLNGKPHGQGKHLWNSGEYYQGEWVNGLREGTGIWEGLNKQSYIGEWSEGKKCGLGIQVEANGDRYEGQFKESLKHGHGIEVFTNGDIYKGEYQKGKFEKQGSYFWQDGSYYHGNFVNGLRNGEGVWKKCSGHSDCYQGEYLLDLKSGKGIFSWASGNKYKGNYLNDLRDGYGQFYWKDGSFYKGYWRKGMQHGRGEIFSPTEGLQRVRFEENILIRNVEQSFKGGKTQKIQRHNLKQDIPQILPDKQPSNSKSKFWKNFKKSKQVHLIDDVIDNYSSSTWATHMDDHKRYNFTTKIQRNQNKKQKISQSANSRQNRILHSSFHIHKMHVRKTSNPQNKFATTIGKNQRNIGTTISQRTQILKCINP